MTGSPDQPKKPRPIKQPASTPGQQPLGTVRAEQKKLLNHLALPVPCDDKGRKIKTSEGMMLAVLRAIDDVCGGQPYWALKNETIAKRIKHGKATVKRAVRALLKLEVLIKISNKKSGHRANTYGVCWSNLRDFDSRKPQAGSCPAEVTPRPDSASTGSVPAGQPTFFAPEFGAEARGHCDPSEGSL